MVRATVGLLLLLAAPGSARLLGRELQPAGAKCDEANFDAKMCCSALKEKECVKKFSCLYDGVSGDCNARPTVCESIKCNHRMTCTPHFTKVYKEGACCPICEASGSFYKLKSDQSFSIQVRQIYKLAGKKKRASGYL